MKARLVLGFLGVTLATAASAATVNFSGSFRGEASSYNNLGLGKAGVSPSKTFIAGRALLHPNLIVDDHFSVKSQWNLLTSPGFTPNATQALGAGQGSFIFGDISSSALVLSRAWLEWTSDIGVFRLGRMPVSWGYGLLYDAGDSMWDDFQTTMDRMEYRLHLGYVVGAIAYSKMRKVSVLGSSDDQEFYAAYLKYDNPEMEMEAGLLFEKQNRVQNTALTTSQPFNQPGMTYFLTALPYPLSNNVLDLYVKKTSGYFSLGGEISWLNGDSIDLSGNRGSLNAFAALFNVAMDYRKVKSFIEVVYATGDSNFSDGALSGFVLLNRNRRPGLILGRELLGDYVGNNVAQGTLLAYGDNGVFSGVFYVRPGVRIDWTPTLTSAFELIYARKAATSATEDGSLGLEIDAGTEYAVYKNFRLGLDLGLLFPGGGLRVPSSTAAFALRTTASVTF